jgi:hypothetical protein
MVVSGLALRLRAGLRATRFVAVRHIVELPRWCGQLTALHLNVASHGFNTKPLQGRVDPVRNINKDANHCDEVS